MKNDAQRLLSGDAWRDWCRRIEAAGEEILGAEFPDGPRDRAEGFRFLTRLLVHATQLELETGDPRHPSFLRYETPINQWGGPNPDNTYLRAAIDPSLGYRVWADVRGVRQAIFSLHEGEMHLGEFGVYSERSLADFEVDADGSLEIQLARDEQPRNWMPLDPKARLLTIRIFQSDWERDSAPAFHIERVGAEGVPRPPLDAIFVARALDRSATWIEKSVPFWNGYTRQGWERARTNVANPARSAPGGADNILYGSCFFELAEDEALLIELEAPDADYWGFTLHTLAWLESGDFAERQTSVNGHQAHRDDDGRVRVVLAARDPGVPNWIDTEARPRGLLVYRFVWARNNPVPNARVVAIDALRDTLPEGHPVVDAAERRRRLAHRRECAWNRFQ